MGGKKGKKRKGSKVPTSGSDTKSDDEAKKSDDEAKDVEVSLLGKKVLVLYEGHWVGGVVRLEYDAKGDSMEDPQTNRGGPGQRFNVQLEHQYEIITVVRKVHVRPYDVTQDHRLQDGTTFCSLLDCRYARSRKSRYCAGHQKQWRSFGSKTKRGKTISRDDRRAMFIAQEGGLRCVVLMYFVLVLCKAPLLRILMLMLMLIVKMRFLLFRAFVLMRPA